RGRCGRPLRDSAPWSRRPSTPRRPGGHALTAPEGVPRLGAPRAHVTRHLGVRLTDQASAVYTSWTRDRRGSDDRSLPMPTKTADPTAVFTDAVIAGVKQSQELAYSGISLWVDFAGKAL